LGEKNLKFLRDGNTLRKSWLSRFVAAQGMKSSEFNHLPKTGIPEAFLGNEVLQ